MVRQRLDVPPHSQPPRHTGKVGSLKTDRQILCLHIESVKEVL